MTEDVIVGDLMIICPDCKGTGIEPQSENKKCVTCKGRASVPARLFQENNSGIDIKVEVVGRVITDKEFWDSMGNNQP